MRGCLRGLLFAAPLPLRSSSLHKQAETRQQQQGAQHTANDPSRRAARAATRGARRLIGRSFGGGALRNGFVEGQIAVAVEQCVRGFEEVVVFQPFPLGFGQDPDAGEVAQVEMVERLFRCPVAFFAQAAVDFVVHGHDPLYEVGAGVEGRWVGAVVQARVPDTGRAGQVRKKMEQQGTHGRFLFGCWRGRERQC